MNSLNLHKYIINTYQYTYHIMYKQILYSELVDININSNILIESSNISIKEDTKYFILGQNGSGKTTLMKHIYNKLKDNIDILMIEQDIEIDNINQTIEEFILDANHELYSAYKQLSQLESQDELTDEDNILYESLSNLVYSNEWSKYESESKKILNGLGFTDYNILVKTLSGGKRMLLVLGRALLRKPKVLMLDEPTNHLDLNTVIWLNNYLESYNKTLIIITHQIELVNNLSDIIWYVGNLEQTHNKIYTVNGKYNNLLKFLDNTHKELTKNYDKFTKRVQELRKKSKTKKEVDEFIKKNQVMRPSKPYIVNIIFDNVIESYNKDIIKFDNVSFSYQNKQIYSNLNINIGMGDRIILVGNNGCGKTTFF